MAEPVKEPVIPHCDTHEAILHPADQRPDLEQPAMRELNSDFGEPPSRGLPVSWLVGGMAERTIALVLKTSGLHGPGGSNPPPSAL